MLALALLALAEAVALRSAVAGDPVLHVLLQMPLLALAGVLAVWSLPPLRTHAVPMFLVALTCGLFWMLPRNVDWALTPWGELAKYVTLPLLLGAPLRLSWPRLGPLLRGFVQANLLSMLGLLGFLYIHAPIRICNAYLVTAQQDLGFAFLYVAGGLTCLWTAPLFFDFPGGAGSRALQTAPHKVETT